MSKEFGLYPTDCTPQYWWGARAIVTNSNIKLLWNRQSFDGDYYSACEDSFFGWIDEMVIPIIQIQYFTQHICKGEYTSLNGAFKAIWDNKNSGGYLYIGAYKKEKYNDKRMYEGTTCQQDIVVEYGNRQKIYIGKEDLK